MEDKIREAKLSNPATMAFLGDAVYELFIREKLVSFGTRQADSLHKEAIKLVCASAQAKLFDALIEELTEDEREILKRGRNAHTARVPKHSTPNNYRKATGMETLFGFLKLSGQEQRLGELLERSFEILREEINL